MAFITGLVTDWMDEYYKDRPQLTSPPKASSAKDK